MSRRFVESFFPAVFARLSRSVPGLVSHLLFPDDVAVLCPEVSFVVVTSIRGNDGGSLPTVAIRNPVLGLWAMAGIWVGLRGTQRLRSRYNKEFQGDVTDDVNNCKIQYRCLQWWYGSWCVSFASFALMNAVAVPLHCLFFAEDSPKATTPQEYPWLWAADCFFTGASSTLISAACLTPRLAVAEGSDNDRSTTNSRLAVVRFWLVFNTAVVLLSVIYFLLASSPDHEVVRRRGGDRGGTLALELWYLLPTVVAGYLLLPTMILDLIRIMLRQSHSPVMATTAAAPAMAAHQRERRRKRSAVIGIAVSLLGGFMGLAGIPLDAPACRRFPPPSHPQFSSSSLPPLFMDALTAPAMLFGGCVLVFAGLERWLLHGGGASSYRIFDNKTKTN